MSLLILTGSLGSGKTTIARLLAAKSQRGVHIESDLFYGFFSHRIAPHLPQAQAQNEAAIAAAVQAACSLSLRGHEVVLEGIFGPWFLPLIAAELGAAPVDLRYVVLRTSLHEACQRVIARGDAAMEAIVKVMHAQFENLGAWAPHAFDVSGLDPEALALRLTNELAAGLYRLDRTRMGLAAPGRG